MRPIHPARSALIVALLAYAAPASFALDDDVTMQGGDTTVSDSSPRAYDRIAPNLNDAAAVALHEVGQTGFLRNFGRVKIRGALRLGPTFNAPSCVSCHGGNGRGALRVTRRAIGSDTVVKVSLPRGKASPHGGPIPVPGIGLQIRDHGVAPHHPEAVVRLLWRNEAEAYNDGTPYTLRAPTVKLTKPQPVIPRGTLTSLRRAPPVFGSGLLDAVSDTEILSRADPADTNGDGISGRANVVWNLQTRSMTIGRFGFKASSPTLRQQVAAAYATDMGITNPLFKRGSKAPDISAAILDATTFYSATLGVPMARDQNDPTVMRGRTLFSQFGCHSCHTPTLTTGSGSHPALSQQTIHPFTDLLLHDMGEGLADHRPDFTATGSEWRTTPLWGIGLTEQVLNGRAATYLHDGRARSLEEAILWHGGEASGAQSRFKESAAVERGALITFLRSL
ncbi:MAG: hypothetical protein RIS36_226 [Pseudomonadota bacterium]|jgi:CxxC motif-containing protein (DUF1111 family)